MSDIFEGLEENLEERESLQKLLVKKEGIKPQVYQDTKNLDTVGVGHLLTPEEKETGKVHGIDYTGGLDKEKIFEIFKKDLAAKAKLAREITPEFDYLPEHVQNQLVSSTYRGLWPTSTKARTLFEQKKYAEAAEEFKKNKDYRNNPELRERINEVSDAIKSLEGVKTDVPQKIEGEPRMASFFPSTISDPFAGLGAIPVDPFTGLDTVGEDKISQSEAAWEGVKQGVSWGFSDEIEGFLKSGAVRGPEYEAAVKEARDKQKLAQSEWKKTYLGAELGTGLVTGLLIPTAAGGSIARTAAIAAAEGAVTGLGYGEGTVEEHAKSVALGTLIGGAAGGAFAGLAKGAPKLWAKLRAGKATKEEIKEIGDIVGQADDIAANHKDIDDMVHSSYYKKDALSVDLEDISTDRMSSAVDTAEEARNFIRSKFGDQADEYVGGVSRRKITGLEDLREKVEPFYVKGDDSITDEMIDELAADFSAVKKPENYEKIRNEALDKIPEEQYFKHYEEYANSPETSRIGIKDIASEADATNAGIRSADDVAKEAELVGKVEARRGMEFPEVTPSLTPSARPRYSDEDYIKAYYVYRNELINYMKFVTAKAGEKPAKKTATELVERSRDMASPTDAGLKKLKEAFDKEVKQGRVNQKSWENFKGGEYLAESLHLRNQQLAFRTAQELSDDVKINPEAYKDVEKLASDYEKLNLVLIHEDPLNKAVGKVLDYQTAAQISDDITGLDTNSIVRQMQEATVKKSAFDRELIGLRTNARKLAKSEGMSPEDVVRRLEAGESSPAIDEYRKLGDELFRALREEGSTVKYRENWVPHKKKSGADLILAMEKRYNDLRIDDIRDEIRINDLIKRLDDEEIDDILQGVDASTGNVLQFIGYLKSQLNSGILTIRDVKRAMDSNALRSGASLKRARHPEIGAAFERKGEVPEWIREYNIDKLMHSQIDTTSKLKFLEPVASKMDTRIPVLREMGQHRTAEMMHNWRRDIMGTYRDSWVNKGSINRLKYELWASDKGSVLRGAPELLDIMSTSIYPNLIGLSPKAVLRNLTQPTTMTAPDMGWKYGIKNMVGAYGDLMKQGWKKSMQELDDYHLRVRDPGAEAFEGLKSGIVSSSRGMEVASGVIDKYARGVMAAFTKSDEINRFITMRMAKRMANDIVDGNITDDVKKALKLLPPTIQQKISNTMGEYGVDTADRVARELASYYVGKTQLIYGKVAMHELGRDLGPMMAMMTKWPVAIGSDVYYKAINKDFSGIAKKYFAPYIAATALSGMVLPSESARKDALVGSGGFQDWLPVNSLFSMTDILVPLNVGTIAGVGKEATRLGANAFSGNWGAKDSSEFKRAGRRAVQQFLPIGGGLWRAYETWYKKLLLGER